MSGRAGILVLREVLGAVLFTTGVVLGEGFLAGLMVGVSLGLFGLAFRERDAWPSWFKSYSLIFLGTAFLVGNVWLLVHGKTSSPAFITFGPFFLATGLYSIIKRLITRTQST